MLQSGATYYYVNVGSRAEIYLLLAPTCEILQDIHTEYLSTFGGQNNASFMCQSVVFSGVLWLLLYETRSILLSGEVRSRSMVGCSLATITRCGSPGVKMLSARKKTKQETTKMKNCNKNHS